MTFENLVEVNKTLKTTDIKGKDYVEVNERIKAFRQLFPEGFIRTALISLENGMCVIQAEVGYDEKVLGTGLAYEKENEGYINKTSFIENCETSAVGRALGMLGVGIDTSVASANEVKTAIAQQEKIKEKEAEAKYDKKIERLISDKIDILVDLGHDSKKIRDALENEEDKLNTLDKWIAKARKDQKEKEGVKPASEYTRTES